MKNLIAAFLLLFTVAQPSFAQAVPETYDIKEKLFEPDSDVLRPEYRVCKDVDDCTILPAWCGFPLVVAKDSFKLIFEEIKKSSAECSSYDHPQPTVLCLEAQCMSQEMIDERMRKMEGMPGMPPGMPPHQ